MDVWSFFYFLLVFLMVICIALSCHGLNPIRLIRSSLKAPQLYLGHNHLHTTMTSNRTEKETLLPIKRSIQYSDTNPRLYTHVMEDLRQCFHSTQDINEFLGDLDLKTLIDTPLKARHFAHVLCHHRMEEDSSFSIFHQFSISTISKIIVSFLKFSKEEPIAQCIKQCFLSQTAKQLIVLKNEVEQFLSLYHLIYKKLRSKKIRQEILNHFQQEANQLLLKEEPQFQRPFKLICDIDDTVYAALFDLRFPEMTVYPGFREFCEEILAIPQVKMDTKVAQYKQRITFLTARPQFLRKRSKKDLQASGFTHFTLLVGRVTHMMGAKRIAAAKLENFKRLRAIFPEYRFIFIGDNGQGDIDLGKTMLESPETFCVASVLIHDVFRQHHPRGQHSHRSHRHSSHSSLSSLSSHLHSSHSSHSSHCWNSPTQLTTSQTSTSTSLIHQFQYRGEECEQAGISQFRTYIGAIFELYCCGVVKMEAVYRVILATSNSFTKIAFKSERRRQFCGEEIMLDIGMVMEEMERKGDKQSRKKEQLIASLNQELIQYGEKYQQRCVQNAFNSFHFEQNDEIA